jgi:hypothetical protein
MALTLAGALPKLQSDLYKAFYDAYKTQFTINSQAGAQVGIVSSGIDKAANQFAMKLSQDMSKAIYDFVKEIGIQANASGVVVSPSGPCTGIIPIPNFTIL